MVALRVMSSFGTKLAAIPVNKPSGGCHQQLLRQALKVALLVSVFSRTCLQPSP